jgi:hypothetical protein
MPLVYMRFEVFGPIWICEFVETDQAGTTLRTLRVGAADKIREMAQRGGALRNLESRQMLEYGISSGRGGVTLNLTPEQYARLKV